jgi:hypothetical protein
MIGSFMLVLSTSTGDRRNHNLSLSFDPFQCRGSLQAYLGIDSSMRFRDECKIGRVNQWSSISECHEHYSSLACSRDLDVSPDRSRALRHLREYSANDKSKCAIKVENYGTYLVKSGRIWRVRVRVMTSDFGVPCPERGARSLVPFPCPGETVLRCALKSRSTSNLGISLPINVGHVTRLRRGNTKCAPQAFLLFFLILRTTLSSTQAL